MTELDTNSSPVVWPSWCYGSAESQGDESTSITASNNGSKSNGDHSNGSGSERGNGNDRGSSSSTTHKSKRKPSAKQVHQHKPSAEQQSPTHLSSTTSSPPMTPPPVPVSQPSEGERGSRNSGGNHNGNSGGSSPPQQPIKQMEQMMSSSSRNYSEFMRSLAAKYNQQSNHNETYFPNLSFDTRFLKPSVAHAFLNLSQLPSPVLLDKEKFPMIDMSSTQTLLSMVRSASAAAAAAAANNNNNTSNHNNNNNNECFPIKSSPSGGTKRPNSPLDLSAREIPPLKKGKVKGASSPLDLMMQSKPTNIMMAAAVAAAGAGHFGHGVGAQAPVCMSSCASGCSEEAQTMINWSVDEVCQFVSTIDLCKDYVEIFRDNSIDGSALPLLTEEHLMTGMNMKLGPALKFRSTVAKRLGNCVICSHCTHCHNHNNNA